jgi:lipopolysaccharide export LptBFGC system permease protein LptF
VNQFSSDRVSMRWRAADESGALLDVGFDLHPQDGGDVSGEAARARIARDDALDYLWFDFTDLRMTTGKDSAPQSFRELTLSYSVASLFGSNGNRERRSSMTNRELEFRAGRAVRSGAPEDDEDVLSYRTECAARTSLAFACIVFVLVGAPLGMRFRQGSFLGAGFMAVLLAFVVYYPLHEVGWHLSWEGTLPSGVAMAIPGTVVGSFGLLLLFRVMKR